MLCCSGLEKVRNQEKKITLIGDERKLYICIICQHHLLFEKQSSHSEMSRSGISQGWKTEEKDRVTSLRELDQM